MARRMLASDDMRRRRAAAARSAVLFMLFPIALAAVSQDGPSLLDRASLDQALTIAAQSSAARRTFHARYTFTAPSPIERIEIVTPLRRAVIEARRQAMKSGRLPRRNELRAALRTHRTGVAVIAVVRLDPRHTYIGPPAYSVQILTRDAVLGPVATIRTALGPRRLRIPSQAVGGSVSMTAVEIEARFPSNPFGARDCCRVTVVDPEGGTVGNLTIDAGVR